MRRTSAPAVSPKQPYFTSDTLHKDLCRIDSIVATFSSRCGCEDQKNSKFHMDLDKRSLNSARVLVRRNVLHRFSEHIRVVRRNGGTGRTDVAQVQAVPAQLRRTMTSMTADSRPPTAPHLHSHPSHSLPWHIAQLAVPAASDESTRFICT